jgi:hypothetical protein
MQRMTKEEFRTYLLDTVRHADELDLERIGRAAIGPGVKYVSIADGFEIQDDTMPSAESD